MPLDHTACYRAISARNSHFDGRFFTAVRTTGNYCRPVCPARTPKPENVTFYPSASGAQAAGFRPCLRCRPENAPDLANRNGTADTVTRALALIAQGTVAAEAVDILAERLGVGERHLRRLFKQHLGASPIAAIQTRRILFAKQLISETRMPLAEVATASGFGSVTRFNAIFQALFDRPPGELRRLGGRQSEPSAMAGITLRLAFAPPYDWDAMVRFLAARAIEGVESVDANLRYSRVIELDGAVGNLCVEPNADSLSVRIRFPRVESIGSIVERIKRVFDLGVDPGIVGKHLVTDPKLVPLVERRPGLRVPGAWDGFEIAVRAILGQQVTVIAARRLAHRLVLAHGRPCTSSVANRVLTHAFPSPQSMTGADLRLLGMPATRAAALSALADAALADRHLFDCGQSLETGIERLRKLRGVGDWTAQVIAMRAMRETDAFPAADVALMRGYAGPDDVRPSAAELTLQAERWRPWRAYAAQHLWTADADRRFAAHPNTPGNGRC